MVVVSLNFFDYKFVWEAGAMEEIQHSLLESYSEERLTLLVFYLRNMNPMEMMYFLNIMIKILDRNSSVIMLAYLLNAQSKSITYPRYAQRALNYHVHALNKKISKKLPKTLHRFVPGMKLFSFSEASSSKNKGVGKRRFNPLGFLMDTVFEVLVRTSNGEMENSVRTYFHEDSNERKLLDPVTNALGLLCEIKDAEAVRKSIARIVQAVEATDAGKILSFVDEHTEHRECFLFCLYLMRPDVYESVLQTILEDKRYFRLEIIQDLVEFDVAKVMERLSDESAGVLKYILRERVGYIEEATRMIEEGQVKISRAQVMEAITENYENVRDRLRRFGLSVEEQLEICRCNDSALCGTLERIESQEELNKFVDVLKEKDDRKVIEVIERQEKTRRKEDLISTILRRRVIKGRLRKHLLSNYLEGGRFVYGLLPYLEKPEVYKYVADYITDDESLNTFLRVVECSELLIFAHKIPEVSKAMRILDLCFKSPRFTESDFLFALTSLEKDLPLLIMRTLIQTLVRFPNLKNFVVSFLSRLSRRDVWGQEEQLAGMVKCLEMIGGGAVDIIAYLDEGPMYKVLSRSAGLGRLCKEYLGRKSSDKHPKAMLVSVMNRITNERH